MTHQMPEELEKFRDNLINEFRGQTGEAWPLVKLGFDVCFNALSKELAKLKEENAKYISDNRDLRDQLYRLSEAYNAQ